MAELPTELPQPENAVTSAHRALGAVTSADYVHLIQQQGEQAQAEAEAEAAIQEEQGQIVAFQNDAIRATTLTARNSRPQQPPLNKKPMGWRPGHR